MLLDQEAGTGGERESTPEASSYRFLHIYIFSLWEQILQVRHNGASLRLLLGLSFFQLLPVVAVSFLSGLINAPSGGFIYFSELPSDGRKHGSLVAVRNCA